MVHPLGVDLFEQHDALQLAGDVLAQLRLTLGVQLMHLLFDLLGELLAVHALELIRLDVQQVAGNQADEVVAEALHVPVLRLHAVRHVHADRRLDRLVHHGQDGILEVLAVQYAVALAVDDLALLVHDVVELQDVFTDAEVAALDLALGALDGVGEDLVLDRGVLVDLEGLHQVVDAVAAEQSHQVVFQRQVEAGAARVALTAGTAAQLVVDTSGFVALGADDEQTAGLLDLLSLGAQLLLELLGQLGEALAGLDDLLIVGVAEAGRLNDQVLIVAFLAHLVLGQELGVTAQHDIGTTAGHVGGDGDRTVLARLCDDLRFLLVVLGVEHLMLDAVALEQGAQLLGGLDRDGADQDRLALGVALLNLFDNGVEFASAGLVDDVRQIGSDNRLVGRDLDNVHAIDLAELLLLGHGGTGHTGQLFVHTEQVLVGDGGQRLGLALNLHALFCLDGLMQALAVTAAVHDTAGELVDDEHLIVLDDVVDVAVHGAVRLDGLVDVVLDGGVLHIHQVFQPEEFLRLLDTGLGQGRGLGLLVDDVVGVDDVVVLLLVVQLLDLVHLQGAGEAVGHLVQVGGLVAAAGDDQRGSGLIDQNRVDLVDHREVVAALHAVLFVNLHVVAQIVETKLVVGAVGDVRLIGFFAVGRLDVVDDKADG